MTLISVRCLQQEVREEELTSGGFRCGFVRAFLYMFVCISARCRGVGKGACLNDWTMTQDDTWWTHLWTKIQQAYVALLLFILLALALKE